MRDLQRMGQSRTEQVTLVVQENLGLVNQPPESRGMDNAVAVPLILRTRGSGRFRVTAPTRVARLTRKRRKFRSIGQNGRQRLLVMRK